VPPGDPVPADIDVHVFVETLNTDDLAALRSAVRPTVAVLNKADLSGFRGDGPMMAATRRCRELHRAFAMPARPLSALLAVAATDPAVLDAELFDALRTLVTAPTAVSDTARLRLASSLDLFGTACAMSAVRAGAGRGGVSALLRAVSGIDEVCDEIDRAGAVVRYRRLTADSGFGDDAVLTRMAAAAEVVRRPRLRMSIRSPTAGGALAALRPRPGFGAAPGVRDGHRPRCPSAVGAGRRGSAVTDTVAVIGAPGAGVTAVAAALDGRIAGCAVVEPAGLRRGQFPDAVVFVATAAAPMSPCDAALFAETVARTDAVVAAVTKIDVHRSWRSVLETNRSLLQPARWASPPMRRSAPASSRHSSTSSAPSWTTRPDADETCCAPGSGRCSTRSPSGGGRPTDSPSYGPGPPAATPAWCGSGRPGCNSRTRPGPGPRRCGPTCTARRRRYPAAASSRTPPGCT
jgi:hypothetical protein